MSEKLFSQKQEWFVQARFGIFAHFGLYSLLGGNENKVRQGSRAVYAKLMKKFNPSRFDADEWVKMVKDSGARYLVPTSKHGEGFSLWDTAYTKYKCTNTPFKRDLLAELASACAKHDLTLGLYYNVETWLEDENPRLQDAEAYADFVEGQIRELVTGYGRIGLIWFDHCDSRISIERMRKIVKLIHDSQPTAVVNDRGVNVRNWTSKPPRGLGDFVTPERHIPHALLPKHEVMECCDAMGLLGWGYYEGERFWSTPELCRRLSKVAALGGNYLLNIEPQADGRIRPECVERMKGLGEWLRRHQTAVLDAEACPLIPRDPGDTAYAPIGVSTQEAKRRRIYLHLHSWPLSDSVFVRNVRGKIKQAVLEGANTVLKVEWQKGTTSGSKGGYQPEGLLIHGLPATPPGFETPILRLDFQENPVINTKAKELQVKVKCLPGETVYLLPTAAEMSARGGVPWQRINRFSNGATTLGHYIRPGCETVWHLEVAKAGDYEVAIDLGTCSGQAGATFAISAGRQTITGITKDNGWYDTPERMAVGRLRIAKGKQQLKLTVVDMPKAFSDVHALVLQPVKPASK
jgi:alpha-L-fucosidase